MNGTNGNSFRSWAAAAGAAMVLVLAQVGWADVVLGSDSKLVPSDAAEYDNFGLGVSVSGRYAVVGAQRKDNYTGSAYVFKQDASGSWTQMVKLQASDAVSGSRFGDAVSIDGDYVLVGASRSGGGAAYVYHRNGNGWTETAKLTASSGLCFGEDVCLSGNYAIVGSRAEGSHAGAAYIYERTGAEWTRVSRLTAPDAAVGDYFGGSVAIHGDYALVGAFNDGDLCYNGGSAYFYHRNGANWEPMGKVNAPDTAKQDHFGTSCAIDGDYAVIACCGADEATEYGGALYVYHRDGDEWSQVAKLMAPDALNSDGLGCSVSISGDTIAAGIYGHYGTGATYVFQRDGEEWTLLDKYVAANGADYSEMSYHYAAIDGENLLIGTPGDGVNGTKAGALYATTVPVPEPATLTLLVAALAGPLLRKRRRTVVRM